MTRLILASASAARARMLREAGVAFDIVPAAVDEAAARDRLSGADPTRVAEMLAGLKAAEVSRRRPEAMVLGADQIVVFGDEILGKSTSRQQAAAQLVRMRGRPHRLVTAALLMQNGVPLWRHAETATLWMRDFSDEFLAEYLSKEDDALLACVGGYRLEGLGAQLFSRIEGDYFTVLGLPLLPVLAALREHGAIPT